MQGLRLGILASGSGSNLQSILEASQNKVLASQVVCVISNKKEAYALERAKNYGVSAYSLEAKEKDYDKKILELFREHGVNFVVLAGYLKIIDQTLLKAYPKAIINIHPSLLPKFGGKGYYGKKVHEAVLLAKETVSGASVHYVDEGIDTGEIILQEKVPVYQTDTPEVLAKRVLEIEHQILVKAIAKIEREAVL